MFPDSERSSPTVSTASIQTVLMLAASEKRHVKVVDVKSAYLQAPMPKDKDNDYIRLDKISSDFLCRLDPSYLAYQRFDGPMILRLDKALYGLVQSGVLWYKPVVVRDTNVTLAGLRTSDQQLVLATISEPSVKDALAHIAALHAAYCLSASCATTTTTTTASTASSSTTTVKRG